MACAYAYVNSEDQPFLTRSDHCEAIGSEYPLKSLLVFLDIFHSARFVIS